MDLYPTKLEIENLYCFRGKHSADLEAIVYAITAQADDNPDRSNWLGKSTLLLAFAFALYGWHTKRTDNEIVTNGETQCSVRMTLNDGFVIERFKAKGQSTQIRFYGPGVKTLSQTAAQTAIEQHIGLTEDNFFAMYFFEQKKIGALVTAKSSEKASIVEGWLAEELEPIIRLNDAVLKEHKLETATLADLEREASALDEDWKQLVIDLLGVDDRTISIPSTIEFELKKLEVEHKELKLKLDGARREMTEVEVNVRLAAERSERAAEYEALVKKGIEKRAEFDKLPADAQRAYEAAQAETEAARIAVINLAKKVQKLQEGDYQFDGKCPIACDTCPSKSWVDSKATSKKALKDALEERGEACSKHNEKTAVSTEKRRIAEQRAALDKELTALRAKVEQLMESGIDDSSDSKIDPTAVTTKVVTLEEEVARHSDKIRQLNEDKAWAQKAIVRKQELTKLIASSKERRALLVEAAQLTGRTGAQQAVQEIVMSKVEAKANDILVSASIPLQISIDWEQETSGLAKVCPTCGSAFPGSQRVKACDTCGATRGPNVQSKLVIEPSNRSGAAEDLAGFVLGIAASRWLRAHRGSRWAAAFIDEPFGALDPHNRTALGGHIASVLRQEFKSAFVVAHERSVLLAMPAQIKIAANQTGSRIEGTVT